MIEIEINNAQEVAIVLERLSQATTHRTPLMRVLQVPWNLLCYKNFDVGGASKMAGT